MELPRLALASARTGLPLASGSCTIACDPHTTARHHACTSAHRLLGRLSHTEARWRSGYAPDCKSVYAGSIPARASKHIADHRRSRSPSQELAQLRGILRVAASHMRLCRDGKWAGKGPGLGRVSAAYSASTDLSKSTSLHICATWWLVPHA